MLLVPLTSKHVSMPHNLHALMFSKTSKGLSRFVDKWGWESNLFTCHCARSCRGESVSHCNSSSEPLVAWTSRADNWKWAKPTDRKQLEICSAPPDMVHLCVSISNDGVRLESVQKGSPSTPRNRKKTLVDMATLRRQMRSRTGSSRQDRGSCSSTASCPVFSGPYSDHEEDPPLRRQSSPLLKGSLSSLQNSASESLKGSVPSLQGSVPCLQGSLPSLRGSQASFKEPVSNLKGSISRMKRRSLGSLENSSPILSERSISPSIQSRNGSSSDDDNSWDTNSWSSGATCLRRTPVKQDPPDELGESGEKSYNTKQEPDTTVDEPEIIYQNLIFARPAAKTDSKEGLKRTFIPLKKDAETQSFTSSQHWDKNPTSASSKHWDKNTDDRRKFSQFLNEVSFRVLKPNNGPSQQQMSLRHRYPSPPPPPPSTPSHSTLTAALHSPPSHLPPAAAATNLWYSPTNSNLQTIKECALKENNSCAHHWSKTLPSCKILEPGDVLQKVESLTHRQHDLELCTKLQARSSSGRLYLETDIDRVRQLDELVSNDSLGKERNKKELAKSMEREKEMEKRRETPWERERGAERGKKTEKGTEKPCWDKDKRKERGRAKEKKVPLNSYDHSAPPVPPPPQIISGGQSNPCPTFTWSEGFPRLSYRSTSLPRPVNMTVSRTVTTWLSM